MKSHHRPSVALSLTLVLLALLALLAQPAAATDRGTSTAGVEYTSGGASHEEQEALHAQRLNYSFWLTTAVRRSGAYLAGVRVRIREAGSNRLMLEHVLDGPWLFAALPQGRYEVEAIVQVERVGRIEVQRGTTTIHAGDHHQMLLYFTTPDADGEEPPKLRPDNPYYGGG